MRFKIQFIIFLLIIATAFIIIWSSKPKINLKISYRERIGDPIKGMTVTDLSITTKVDTIHCQKLYFIVRSINPINFEIWISNFSINIGRSGGGGRRFWFIPFKITGHVKLIDGQIRFKDNLIDNINGDLNIDAAGPILWCTTKDMRFDCQGHRIQSDAKLLINPGMVEVREGKIKTDGLDAQFAGSIIGPRTRFTVAGQIDLDRFTDFTGRLAVDGRLEYEDGILSSDLKGVVYGLFIPDTFPVLINALGDSIKVICPRIESDPGFANLRALFVKSNLVKADLEFNQFQIRKFIPTVNLPIDGQLTLNRGRWRGKLSSLSVGLDSILIDQKAEIFDIHGFCQDGFCKITGREDSLLIQFSRFPLMTITQTFGLTGAGLLTGVIKKEDNTISGELEADDLSYGRIKAKLLKCVVPKLELNKFTGYFKIEGYGFEFLGVRFEDFTVDYDNRDFLLQAGDSVVLKANWQTNGFLIKQWTVRTDKFKVTSLKPFNVTFGNEIKIVGLNLYLDDGLVKGNVTIGERMDLDLLIQNLDIKRFDSKLNGRLSIKGYGNQANFMVDDLRYRGVDFGAVSGSVSLLKNQIRINGNTSNISFEGNLLPDPEIRFSLKDVPLSYFWFFKNLFQLTGCFLNGDLVLGKRSSGSVTIGGDQILIRATRSMITGLKGNISLKGNRIIFSSLTGKTEHGSVKATGWLDLEDFKLDTLHLVLEYNQGYISLSDIHGFTNGHLMIEAGKRVLIRGEVDVIEGIYSYDLAGARGKTKKVDDLLDLDLVIHAPQGIRLIGYLLSSDLSGELRLKKKGGVLALSGEFGGNRGEIYYLDHNLKIDYATVTFINDPEINPLIDLKANMPTRLGYRIILRVTGRLREPQFTFSSDPEGLSEQDIITFLNTGFTWTEIQEMGSEDRISALASERFLRLLTYGLSKELRGLSGLDYLDIETSQLTVGKYLRPNLFFSYTHQLGRFSADAFEVDYALRPKERIVIEKLQEGEYSIQYKLRIKF